MIYVFRTEKLYTTTNTEFLKKRKNYIVVDATGTKYVETGAHKVKWQGIFGYFTGMLGRVISIEYEYKDKPEPFPLQKLQELIAERYPKTRWFKEKCWENADEFRQAIFACKTFEEVADILMPRPQTAGERIKKWLHPTRKELKFRIGDLSCFSCYTCWHVTGYLAWNRKTRWKKDASLFIKHEEIIGEILQYQLLLHL